MCVDYKTDKMVTLLGTLHYQVKYRQHESVKYMLDRRVNIRVRYRKYCFAVFSGEDEVTVIVQKNGVQLFWL
jgi:hypothetical protein